MRVEQPKADACDVAVSPLIERDVPDADRIFRLAFGTFFGLPDASAFGGDTDYVRTRFYADQSAAFGAYVGTQLVGSNFATNWGNVGFFGPLTVRPDLWNRSVGKRVMEPIIALFTFPHSQKHVGLYQRFGFWPRFLTAVMSKFGAVHPSHSGADDFETLLSACEAFAVEQGASPLAAGVNVGRHEGYARLLARGFRTDMLGIAMHRRNEEGYHRPGVYVLDDWR
jgi:GNAT superfamily N-acetyltransferase